MQKQQLLNTVHFAMGLTLAGMVGLCALAGDGAAAAPLVMIAVALLTLLGLLAALEIDLASDDEHTLVSAVRPTRKALPQQQLQIGGYAGQYSTPRVTGLVQLDETKVS